MLQLIFAAVLVASASACCFPEVWEAECYLASGTYNETNQQGSNLEGYFTLAYDSKNKILAENQHLRLMTTNGEQDVEQHLVMDFAQKIMFVYRNGSCDKYAMPEQQQPNCLPDDNSQIMIYGQGANYVNARGYITYQNETTSYWTATAADTCIPIAMDSVYKKDAIAQITMVTFQNVTVGVKDSSVFNVPTICATSGPPKPETPNLLGKRSAMLHHL